MKNGELRPLFINKVQGIPIGVWLRAEEHPTKGFALRPGWHVCSEPIAPHLSKRDRVWCKVEVDDVEVLQRPATQGKIWYIAKWMKILSIERDVAQLG
jgi:hypothetical protein